MLETCKPTSMITELSCPSQKLNSHVLLLIFGDFSTLELSSCCVFRFCFPFLPSTNVYLNKPRHVQSHRCYTWWGRAVRRHFVRSVLCPSHDRSKRNIHWHLLLERLAFPIRNPQIWGKKCFFGCKNREIPKIFAHPNMEVI